MQSFLAALASIILILLGALSACFGVLGLLRDTQTRIKALEIQTPTVMRTYWWVFGTSWLVAICFVLAGAFIWINLVVALGLALIPMGYFLIMHLAKFVRKMVRP